MKEKSILTFVVIWLFIIAGWPSRFENRSYAVADTTPPTVAVGQPRGVRC
jgi:hypothetical protein